MPVQRKAAGTAMQQGWDGGRHATCGAPVGTGRNVECSFNYYSNLIIICCTSFNWCDLYRYIACVVIGWPLLFDHAGLILSPFPEPLRVPVLHRPRLGPVLHRSRLGPDQRRY